MKKRVVIIGGGAAGVFSAIQLRERLDCDVTIYEKTSELLKKVKISGGGRCNVTHHYLSQAQFSKNYPRGQKILKQNFNKFSAADMWMWLETRGVKLKTETDGRVFPISNDSQTIIDCFLRELDRFNIKVVFGSELQKIAKRDQEFILTINQKECIADYAIIATGGAQKVRELDIFTSIGIQTISPVPSLFTFKIKEPSLTELMGLSLKNVMIKIIGTDYKEIGDVLITHWGLSGPAILKLSAWAAFELHKAAYNFQIAVQWMGEMTEEQIRQELDMIIQNNGLAKVVNRKIEKFPKRFWDYVLYKAEIELEKKWIDLSKKNVNKLVQVLFHSVYDIQGKTTFKEEFVTAGGINTQDIDSNTMMSKKLSNLYFIGEVTNIDGITGGFNFQNTWTSATVCAMDIAEKAKQYF